MNSRHYISSAIFLIAFFLFSSTTHAKGIPVTGTAYGDLLGLIHFDYQTASNPDKKHKQFNDSKYYIGPTKQFYISPYDGYFNSKNPYQPGNQNITVQINPDDCSKGFCMLEGFAWSDKVGWIALSGKVIDQAISKSISLPAAEENTSKDPYPKDFYPRISSTPDKNGRFSVAGYAWNHASGWIRLSSDDQMGVTTLPKDQQKGNWGVWLDGNSPIERLNISPGPPPVVEKLGRRLHGYAWSEQLGWIKFSREKADSFSFDFSAYTLWIPDNTPPIILSENSVWIAIGVNSGFPEKTHIPSNVFLENFAIDPESGIDEKNSQFYLKQDPNFLDCKVPPSFGKSSVAILGQLTKPIPNNYPVSGGGDILELAIPTIGNLKGTTSSYCKYELHGKVVNQVNKAFYIGDHFSKTIANIPTSSKTKAIQLYVRAGDVAESTSKVKLISSDTALADGISPIVHLIEFNDIAGNPIVNVDCQSEPKCSGRIIKLTANLSHNLSFDFRNPSSSGDLTPVRYAFRNVEKTGLYLSRLKDSNKNPEYNPSTKEWNLPIQSSKNNSLRQLEIASFSPSENYNFVSGKLTKGDLQIKSFQYEMKNEALPATSKLLTQSNPPITQSITKIDYYQPYTGVEACIEPSSLGCRNPDFSKAKNYNGYRVNSGNLPTGILKNKPLVIRFISPIVSSGAQASSAGLVNRLNIGSPTKVSYELQNLSQNPLTSSSNAGLSIDHIFQYYSEKKSNPLLALLEIRKIENVSSNDSIDTDLGWTDPFEIPLKANRYEWYMKGGQFYSAPNDPKKPLTALNSIFKNTINYQFDYGLLYQNIKSSFLTKYGLPSTQDTLDQNGSYYITGREDIPQNYNPIDQKKLSDPYNYSPGKIDHSDSVQLDLLPGSLKQPSSIKKTIQIIPEKMINQPIKDVQLKIHQQIAYRYPNQPYFTIYSSKEPLLKNLNVNDLGLEATGTIAGEKNVIGRQFNTVGTDSIKSLQESIRKNVAKILLGRNLSQCHIPTQPLKSLPTSGNCVIDDKINKTKVLYYEGDKTKTLILGDGNDLVTPNEPYTLIIKGGANLYIKENLIQGAPFGIILIANKIGDESNVYLSPKPTNIQATLYAEGSLISKSFSGKYYYGNNTENVNELSNQLYWQGSIASRNTIGGTQQKILPDGIDCGNKNKLDCAKLYDLDFLRRFNVDIDLKNKKTTISRNGQFSGGGTCNNGTCQLGKHPTTVKIQAGQIIESESELSPVFVENYALNSQNPPPGFNRVFEIKSTQEIR